MDPFISRSPTGQLNESSLQASLEARLQSSPDYTIEEISRVSNLRHKLLNSDLNSELAEHMRALAKLSQQELKPSSAITSHRKYVGRFIVFLKKLSWPLIRVHLKDQFSVIEEYCAWSTSTIARQAQEIEELKARLDVLEKPKRKWSIRQN